MRVAFFIGRLNRGGMETLVLDTFRKRDLIPFDCILIYRNDGELTNDFRATGVPMFRVHYSANLFQYILTLCRILKRENVDVLHTQTVLNGLIGVVCKYFSNIKLVASFHGLLSKIKYKIYAHIVMWNADVSVFVSEYERKWFVNHILFAPKKRCRVVYNGIDFSKFNETGQESNVLPFNVGQIPNSLKMVMVGNFVSGRSQIFLCKALKSLRDRGECKFQFFFIGKQSKKEPERYNECVRFCKESGLLDSSVFFLGGRGDVPSILPYMDAFVYSTECDSFGIAVVEAMAVGIPVVVNDWEVMKEITENGSLADLYKSSDIEDCVRCIEAMSAHINERKALAKKKAVIVRERYSIENHITSLNDVYTSATQRK